MNFLKRTGIGIAALALSAGLSILAAGPARADLIFDLTSCHFSSGCPAAGTVFGTVTLVQNGTTVDFDVHLNSGFAFANTGSVDNQAFKFNATGVVVGDITVNQTVAGKTLIADTGAFNGDGTGTFSFGIACSTCGGGLSDAFTNDIIFHVANATIADLTVPNALGNVFVADVGIPANGATGPVDATVPHTPVPEPASLVIFGTALASLGLVGIRRRRRDEV